MFALALLAACDPDRPKPVDDTGPADTAGADDTGLPEAWVAPELGWVLEGDGCGAVTLDGVSIGEVCGSDYGAWVP